jgi:hypothetical protein
VNRAERRRLEAQQRRRPTPLAAEERRWAAIHEAGHAVAAIHFGHGLETVTIESEHGHLAGHTERETALRPGPDGKPARQEGIADRRLEEEIIIAQAGCQTELIAGRKESIVKRGAETDYVNVNNLLYALGCRSTEEAARILKRLWIEGEKLLKTLWPQVNLVECALFERGTLSESAVREIIGAAIADAAGKMP